MPNRNDVGDFLLPRRADVTPFVSAPMVGATKSHHLPDAVAGLVVHLSDEEVQALEESYAPHLPSAF